MPPLLRNVECPTLFGTLLIQNRYQLCQTFCGGAIEIADDAPIISAPALAKDLTAAGERVADSVEPVTVQQHKSVLQIIGQTDAQQDRPRPDSIGHVCRYKSETDGRLGVSHRHSQQKFHL